MPKSETNKLLDILAGIPGILGSIMSLMFDRVKRLAGGSNVTRESHNTVPDLRHRVRVLGAELEIWKGDWVSQNPGLVQSLFDWSFRRTHGDAYRPGIGGLYGPDVFDSNIFDMAVTSNARQPLLPSHDFDPVANLGTDEAVVFNSMQDISLYTTAMLWITRLGRYLDGAAMSLDATDFLNTPFHSNCTCCSTTVPTACDTAPPESFAPLVDPAMSWNASSCQMAVAPARLLTQPSLDRSVMSSSEETIEELGANAVTRTTLLPADVRFAAQLRTLAWLCERLPRSRPQVLATLAAIGLGHCGHDVRPSEGIEVVSQTVESVLMRTGIEGASDVLLRRYRDSGG